MREHCSCITVTLHSASKTRVNALRAGYVFPAYFFSAPIAM